MASIPAALAARFEAAPFAVLATHGPDGRIDQVPCCFAMLGTAGTADAQIVSAVDHKPKRHRRLARLANIERNPNAAIIADERDPDDWGALWWVRAHGQAVVVDDGPQWERAISALVAAYAQYRAQPPTGPAIVISDLSWSAWAATPVADRS